MSTRLRSAPAWFFLLVAMSCQAKGSDGQEEYVKIDDMEAGLPESYWQDGAVTRRVRWYASTSATCQFDRIQPAPWFPPGEKWPDNQWAFQDRETDKTRGSGHSSRAARLWTTADLQTAPQQGQSERCWGANMTIDLVQLSEIDAGSDGALPADAETPIDLHSYVGLLFWAKASASAQRIQVMVRDQYSDPRGEQCEVSSDGGVPSPGKCYNDFSTFLDLTPTFAPYRVNFSDLWRDPTWGAKPSTYAPDREHVYQIAFQVNAPKCVADENATCVSNDIPLRFDFWIDDLYLVKPK
jgi:hypothetical protein